jgi:hypothetical protein
MGEERRNGSVEQDLSPMKYYDIAEGFTDVGDVMGRDDHMCFVAQ